MNKTIKITNGIELFDIECTNKIHTRVSEECLLQMTYKNKIIPEQVVLQVLLEELKITNKEEWSLCI